MNRKGALTKYEKFYIEQNPQNLTIQELANELGRNINTVGKYVTKTTAEKAAEPQPTPPPPPPKPEAPMFQLIGRHKRNEKPVATMMTKAASELSDATRPGRLKEKHKINKAIHHPKG